MICNGLYVEPPPYIPRWYNWEVDMTGVDCRMVCAMYEETVRMWDGAEMMCETIAIAYDVWFKEAGVILNEHIAQNPDGSPNWEATSETPIEGMYYRHDLKAECG
jgi:hypothetical protein